MKDDRFRFTREYRQRQLFRFSVIIAGVLLGLIYVVGVVTLITKAQGAEVVSIALPKAPRVSLPQQCEHLHIEYTDEWWDEALESYPINHAWEECMGVGRR